MIFNLESEHFVWQSLSCGRPKLESLNRYAIHLNRTDHREHLRILLGPIGLYRKKLFRLKKCWEVEGHSRPDCKYNQNSTWISSWAQPRHDPHKVGHSSRRSLLPEISIPGGSPS